MNAAVIESITCPITQDVMIEPVTGSDGHTYEKNAIERWLREKNTSPLNPNERMEITSLKTNSGIRFLCDKYHSGEMANIQPRQPVSVKTLENDAILESNIYSHSKNKAKMIILSLAKTKITNLQNIYLGKDVVIVIDKSGSMSIPITTGESESGLSVQDVVNHSACTIAKSLGKDDRLSVIEFDSNVNLLTPLLPMTELNQNSVINKIRSITPGTQTALWNGIDMGLKLLTDRDDKTREPIVIAMSDGSPNLSPARGEVETIKRLKEKTNFTTTVNIFGFGNNLAKGGLLQDIAAQASGCFAHIPDGSMIATVFCNYISTIQTTVASNIQLMIKFDDNSKPSINLISGDYFLRGEFNDEFSNVWYRYDVGTIQLEQNRNFIINTEKSGELYFTYKRGGNDFKTPINKFGDIETKYDDEEVYANQIRYQSIESLKEIVTYMSSGNQELGVETFNIHSSILESALKSYPKNQMISQIKLNWDDQIKIALSKNQHGTGFDNWNKWGEFYVTALYRALNQQIKANFKDQATMLFGGKIFNDLVDKSSDIFDTLPPPVPSCSNSTNLYNTYRGLSSGIMATKTSSPINMHQFNNMQGGCFHGNSKVKMYDGSYKLAKNIQAGDYIYGLNIKGENKASLVKCILETKPKFQLIEMCHFAGLSITPWHPIKFNGSWVHPADIQEPILTHCESMFTFLLDEGHIAVINNIEVIMLAHNYTESILGHEYYGTINIVNDMKKMPGWEFGHILLNNNVIYIRNKEDGLVEKIFYQNNISVEC